MESESVDLTYLGRSLNSNPSCDELETKSECAWTLDDFIKHQCDNHSSANPDREQWEKKCG